MIGLINEPVLSEDTNFSLEDCIRLAISNSFEVKLARLDFLISETDLGAAEAVFDANLSATVDYEKDKRKHTNTYSSDASKTFPSGTELTLSFSDTSNPAYETEVSLEARQPIGKNFFGSNDRRDITAAKLAIKNADLDTKERIETLLSRIEKTYWKWAFSKKSLEIYLDILQRAKDLHSVNARNYDTGLIEKGDFLASQANVLLREKDLLLAENKYRRAEESIKLLMNMDADYRIHPEENLEYRKIKINLEDCLKRAFQKRRDYQKAKREIEIKKIVLETKSNKKWPEIDLVASMALNGIDSEFNDNTDYYAGVEISIPIENNLARSEFKKAAHNKEKALVNLKNIERIIVTDIGNAFRDYVTYQANAGKVIEASRLQHEKLKEEEKKFKYGRSNTKRLIDYQEDYLHAQLEVSSGMLDVELAGINLDKALNIILERYEGML